MSSHRRKGARQNRRSKTLSRIPDLGYYIVVTDTKATEKNYLNEFRKSVPEKLQDKLVISVIKSSTDKMIEKALEVYNKESQHRELWIVFDRDRVENFDKIISDAQKLGIKVGWSNPCIEIWFYAYFGEMPKIQTSTKCNTDFEKIFKIKTGQDYDKADLDNYQKLHQNGDEKKAIEIAELRYNQECKNHDNPSEMLSTTTLHRLIGEIIEKTNITT